MSADKRSTHTDALATLGTIITDGGRDAIHLAVEPVIAGEDLLPACHIGIKDGKAYMTTVNIKALGIVDPFITGKINEGQKFWLIVYPRQITSLRHVWEHPDFLQIEEAPKPNLESEFDRSQAWITNFAEQIDQTYNRLMNAADNWVHYEEYTYDNSESYKDHWDKFPEFWKHYEVVRGKAPKSKESFFTCSC
jgi:hypothetical protein